MANKVVVYFGPRSEFDKLVDRATLNDKRIVSYLESIRVYNARIKSSDIITRDLSLKAPEAVDSCIVHADDFGSVLSHVIASFATILEQTFDIGTLYVQNPPKRAFDSLKAAQPQETLEIIHHEYPVINKTKLESIHRNLQEKVLGQDGGKEMLIASLYRLSVMNDDKPSVILFYGPSGVGKTETARCLSNDDGGEITRVQFSMMQTQEAYEYLFGAEHSKASFARDLLARESNIVLIDEIDKVDPRLYNMFYQLFDEGLYVDTNYDVDMKNALFLLTSNFKSEAEAQRVMGAAMFSRIGACVRFYDLEKEKKMQILTDHFKQVVSKLDEKDRDLITQSDILEWFTENVAKYDNVRTMKNKLEMAVFRKLSSLIISPCKKDT
ncbi:AAA family ATPase [Varibaculum cambriense]|uniref:AAA family ATPase n=1 Tax=Varibaculum cambriense TaxID=184870 RepID=UPI00243190CD|nr:AAA family ATPase [Varibaculum cambriense]